MTQNLQPVQSRFRAVFNGESSRFLGQGIYRNTELHLLKVQEELKRAVLRIQPRSDLCLQFSVQKAADDVSGHGILCDFSLTEAGVRIVAGAGAQFNSVAHYLETRVQGHFDNTVWVGRREMAGAITVQALAQNP